MTWQIAFNVFGHCGYEILPSWFLRTRAGAFLNTPTHHAMHHEKVGGNYGLYFNVWDRLLGTNHPDYQRRFEEVTTKLREMPPLPVDVALPGFSGSSPGAPIARGSVSLKGAQA
jgi:sterol desaturase/sphingolipid hydroxylase (fatty acid hydroxylase superfamily)